MSIKWKICPEIDGRRGGARTLYGTVVRKLVLSGQLWCSTKVEGLEVFSAQFHKNHYTGRLCTTVLFLKCPEVGDPPLFSLFPVSSPIGSWTTLLQILTVRRR